MIAPHDTFVPRPGAGSSVLSLLWGRNLSADAHGTWPHPWTVTPAWNPESGSWAASVRPGFVNGRCPVWRTRLAEDRNFGINPLTGQAYFSASVFAQTKPGERLVDIPLYLDPAISLDWRALGYDGSAEFPVPQFFLDRGVLAAPKPPSDEDFIEGDSIDVPSPTPGMRLLRACDLWIHQPRLALASSISLEPGPATGISNVTQTLSLRSAATGDTLRVMSGTLRAPQPFDPLSGDYEEPAWDELLIATVFLLSPPNTLPGSEPDPTWTPYVRHRLFWNLNYATPWFRSLGGDPSVPLIPPLAAGAAQLVINFLTASLNDMGQQALNILAGHSMAGTFFTPTGSGHSAAMPPVEELAPRGSTGLDKDGRLRAETLTKARRKRAGQLDPSYPFQAEPFDPALLTQRL